MSQIPEVAKCLESSWTIRKATGICTPDRRRSRVGALGFAYPGRCHQRPCRNCGRLGTAASTDCCWSQEPGELRWKLRRVDIELEVEILKFDDGTPGQHWRDSECIFKARGKSLTFARQLLSSLERIRINLGPDGCQRAGGRPFPAKEQERLRAAIKTCAGTMRYLADYAIKSGHKSEKSGWNA